MIVREFVTKLGFDIDEQKLREFDSLVKLSIRGVAKLQTHIRGVGEDIKFLGGRMTTFLTAPIVIAGGAMIKFAADAEETRNKFDVIFRDMIGGANDVANAFAKDFRIAGTTSRELLSGTGDLLTGFGFTQEKALELSNQVQRLAGDLASFQNIQGGVQEAGDKLTKGILGETENLKLMGIAVNQGSKEFRAMTKNIVASEKVSERQAKVLAILRIAFSQSKNAIGDFARTQESFSNQWKIFIELLKETAAQFGKFLIPMATRVLRILNSIFTLINKLPNPIKKMIVVFATFVAVLGPIIFVIGSILASFGLLILKIILLQKVFAFFGLSFVSVFSKMFFTVGRLIAAFSPLSFALKLIAVAMSAFVLKLAAVIAIIVAISAVIGLLIEDIAVWVQGGDSLIGSLLGNFEVLKNRIMFTLRLIGRIFGSFWEAINTGNQQAWDRMKVQIKQLARFIEPVMIGMIKVLEKIFLKLPEILLLVLKKVAILILKLGFIIIKGIVRIIGNLFKFLGNEIASRLNKIGKKMDNFIIKKFPRIAKFLGIDTAPGRNKIESNTSPKTILPPGTIAGPNVNNNTTGGNNVNIQSDIKIEVPKGTPDEQVAFVKTQSQKAIFQMFQAESSKILSAFPKSEK